MVSLTGIRYEVARCDFVAVINGMFQLLFLGNDPLQLAKYFVVLEVSPCVGYYTR